MAVDDWHLGLRVSRPEVADAVEATVAGHLVDPGQNGHAPPNWSLRIGGFADGDDGAAALQLLYRAQCQSARSRWPSHVLRALVAELSEFAERPLPGWASRGVLFVGPDDRAVLASPGLARQLPTLGPLLAARGVRASVAPTPRVDTDADQVSIPEPLFPLDPAVTETLDARFGPSTGSPEDTLVAPGTYDLAGWILLAPDDATPTAAASIAAIVETFVPPGTHGPGQRLLDAVAEQLDRLPVSRLDGSDHTSVSDTVVAAIAG